MDAHRFADLIRSLNVTRRPLLGGGLAVAFGWLSRPHVAASARKKRRKRSKLKRNAFGCVNVGNFCKNSDQCCSGICKGKKGKKTCKAHDQGTCQAGQDACLGVAVVCTTTAGGGGACARTTGKASYCFITGDCFPCSKDVECEPLFGDGAACIVCEIDCPETGGTACFGLSEP